MGADFIAARVRLNVPEEVALERLAALHPSRITAAYNEFFDYDEDEEEDDNGEAIRERAKVALKECYHGSRDLVVWDFDGVLWAIAGGLSWGDAPSDAYDNVLLVAALGVTE